MRIRTHGVATAAVIALACACASAPARPRSAGAVAGEAAQETELAALRAKQQEQTQRIAELEVRLALLEADARRQRDDQAAHGAEVPAGEAALRSGETVRIGAARSDNHPQVHPENGQRASEAASDESDENAEIRPSLRLYGPDRGTAAPARAAPGLAPVPNVAERLPVVPLPEQRAAKALRGGASSAPAGPIDQYRAGLRLLHGRHFEEALKQFEAFVGAHPTHALVPSALYWRGEARYAQRDYAGARKEFETLLERFPSAARAPDALFKLGLSLRKLGSKAQSKATFERLRTDYPNSQAAQTAAREGST